MNRRQALQQAGRRQQRRHKRVPDDGVGRGQDVGVAFGPQRLEAVRVVKDVGGASHGGAGRRLPVVSALARRGPGRVQKGLDPVGGSLGEVAEQQGRVPAQSAQAAAPL